MTLKITKSRIIRANLSSSRT